MASATAAPQSPTIVRLTAPDFATSLAGCRRDEMAGMVERHVLGIEPFCFAKAPGQFDEVRRFIARGLSVALDDVLLVGSGQVGYSLTPTGFPKPFRAESDLDFVVVSETDFDAAWAALRHWGHPRRNSLPASEHSWLEDRRNEIFWGWLFPHNLKFNGLRFPTDLKAMRQIRTKWFGTFQSLGREFPGEVVAGRAATARLYRSRQQLVEYQAEGLRRLQYQLSHRTVGAT